MVVDAFSHLSVLLSIMLGLAMASKREWLHEPLALISFAGVVGCIVLLFTRLQ
jgi:hypothetical protein